MNSPSPPDPYATAAAQTRSNISTGQANQETNMVNQTNPFGSLNYSQSGTNPDGTPQYTANTSLSAPLQTALGGLYGNGALSGKPLDLSYNGTASSLDALNRARLDPQWQQNSQHETDSLASRGLVPGTPAYDNEMRVFNQGKNDAYNSANLADYQTAINAAQAQYNSPLQTAQGIAGLEKGSLVNTPTTNIPATNVAGLVEQNYQQQSQNANAQNGQLAGLAGTALSLGAAPFTGGASLLGSGAALGGLFGAGGGSSPGYGNFGQYSPYSPMNAG